VINGPMKWSAAILVAMLYLASPYYTLLELASAIKSSDAAALNSLVDWDRLRASFKAQLEAHLNDPKTLPARIEQQNAGAAVLGNAFALALANVVIDRMVTPQGVLLLIQAAKSEQRPDAKAGASPKNEHNVQASFWDRTRFAFFVSPIQFRLDLSAADQDAAKGTQTITLMFAFKGTGWQLYDILLPKDELTSKVVSARR